MSEASSNSDIKLMEQIIAKNKSAASKKDEDNEEDEENVENNNDEEDGLNITVDAETIALAKFAERAIRAPKGGAYERLLAQHLVLSVSSDPLNSIIHSCRAALTVPPKAAERQGINQDKAVMMLTVAMNLKLLDLDDPNRIFSLSWSFKTDGEKSYDKYIRPWNNKIPACKLYQSEKEEFKKLAADYERFYYASEHLSFEGFRSLESAFVGWAYPFVQEFNQKVATQVQPTTYQEILAEFSKFKT